MSHKFLVFALILLSLSACDIVSQTNTTSPNSQANSSVGLANPASVYCESKGYTLSMKTNADGTYGVCVFPDKSECEEWAFYRGECGQAFNINTEQSGTIEGSLSYPSEGIPEDLKICAIQRLTRQEYCTTEHIFNSNYTYGVGYKLKVPAGDYYVYATTTTFKDYKAYYSEFVTCGQSVDCSSHAPILIPVKAGEITSRVDPADWYN